MATNNAINSPKPFSVTDGGTGLSNPTIHAILVGEGASAINPIVLSDGQLLIGSTALDPVASVLTAGSGIAIINAAGAITISSTGNDPYTDVTASSQALAVNNTYGANRNLAPFITFTLPSTAAVGDKIEVLGVGSTGWVIAQNASQVIHLGNATTTTGITGSLASTNQWDTVILQCVIADTTWTAQVSGNITVV